MTENMFVFEDQKIHIVDVFFWSGNCFTNSVRRHIFFAVSIPPFVFSIQLLINTPFAPSADCSEILILYTREVSNWINPVFCMLNLACRVRLFLDQ